MSSAAALSTATVPAPVRVGQVSEGLRRWRKFKSGFVAALCLTCAVIVITPLAVVFGYLVIKGAGSLNLDFFTKTPVPHGETGGGVLHAILGSFLLVGMASVIGLPTGILAAVYVTEYAGKRFASLVRFSADLLNGVPSIVWGILGYALFVLHFKHYSGLAGAATLAFIIVPLVLRTTEEVLLLVPGGYREAALALGIAKWRIVTRIVLQTASKGILTGSLLAVARISGETAPLLFTTLGNNALIWNPTREMPALPLQIYAYSISPYPDENRQAWAAALVLLLMVLILNVGLRYATRERLPGRSGPGRKNVASPGAAATTAVTGGAAMGSGKAEVGSGKLQPT